MVAPKVTHEKTGLDKSQNWARQSGAQARPALAGSCWAATCLGAALPHIVPCSDLSQKALMISCLPSLELLPWAGCLGLKFSPAFAAICGGTQAQRGICPSSLVTAPVLCEGRLLGNPWPSSSICEDPRQACVWRGLPGQGTGSSALCHFLTVN